MNTDGLISVGERIEHARILYDRALLNGDPGALEEADGGRSASCPDVAGNLVGLTYIAAGQGRRDDALALIEEAAVITKATGARGILRQVDEARASL
jgi:hypothetical protein